MIILFFLCISRRYLHCLFLVFWVKMIFSSIILKNINQGKNTREFWFAILVSVNSSQNYYFYLLFIFLDFAISIKLFLIRHLQSHISCNFRVPIHSFDFVIFRYALFCPSIETGRIKSLSWKNNGHYRCYT